MSAFPAVLAYVEDRRQKWWKWKRAGSDVECTAQKTRVSSASLNGSASNALRACGSWWRLHCVATASASDVPAVALLVVRKPRDDDQRTPVSQYVRPAGDLAAVALATGLRRTRINVCSVCHPGCDSVHLRLEYCRVIYDVVFLSSMENTRFDKYRPFCLPVCRILSTGYKLK